MTDPDELTTFKRHILAVLADGPRKGLAIKEELEAAGYGHVNHGRIYPNLSDLEDAGYIDVSPRDQRTNEYRLTEAGLDRFGELLRFEVQYLDPEQFRTHVMTNGQEDMTRGDPVEVDAGP